MLTEKMRAERGPGREKLQEGCLLKGLLHQGTGFMER